MELVVVITIMMVITAIGVVSFSGINKKSRDSRRMSDLDKLAIALEVFKQENGIYPPSTVTLVSDYIDAEPIDPKSFSYYYVGTDYAYALYAQMEDIGVTTGVYGNNCTGVCNYKITNP